METILSIDLRFERDVVQARQRAREIAAFMGFENSEQIRIATATSEIARNAFRYAAGGKVTFSVRPGLDQCLEISITDSGHGIPHLEDVLDGNYRSKTGMGVGIIGTKRLMDEFQIHSTGMGTAVTFAKCLPKNVPVLKSRNITKIREQVLERVPDSPYEEVQKQNVELMNTLSELRSRQEELDRLNRELEDTNRGVVALYAELEDRADYLRRTSELKTTFLSNMSHEFRTPLNSIVSLTRMLHEGESLSDEQQTEVSYIQQSARDLLDLVNDFLDLAKIEAGKLELRPRRFEVSDLFGALRGMLKPLLVENSLNLVFDDPQGFPFLFTDEGKLSQILRNLVSNAIKFTPRGEVRVSAAVEDEDHLLFRVEDTGIGIADSDIPTIFKEFGQVDNALQSKVRGTGLGLPLSQNLAKLLGGDIRVESVLGRGSVFTLRILRVVGSESLPPLEDPANFDTEPGRLPVLVIEDNHETQFIYESFFRGTRFQMVPVSGLAGARHYLTNRKPVLIILDLLLSGKIEIGFISELRNREDTRNVPLLAISTISDEQRCMELGASAFLLKPIMVDTFLSSVHELTNIKRSKKFLLIDDNEVARYVLRGFLPEQDSVILEARSGREGLDMAFAHVPDLIFLDLNMSDVNGYTVLEELKRSENTKSIPVIIHTSQQVDKVVQRRLSRALDILPKSDLNSPLAEEIVANLLVKAGIAPDSPLEKNHV